MTNDSLCWITRLISNYFGEIIVASVSIITTIITFRFQRKLNIIQSNTDRKKEVYLQFLSLLEELQGKPTLVYDKKFLDKLLPIKPQVKLLAGKKVCDQVEITWEYIIGIYKAYINEVKRLEEKNHLNDTEEIEGEDGKYEELSRFSEADVENFVREVEKYKNEYPCDRQILGAYIKQLYAKMRKELGIKEEKFL